MREMKDSGVDWIGEVPASWDMLRIYQLAFPVKNKNEGMKENNLLSLSYGNIVQKDINKVDGLVPASYEGYNIIEPGDIVLRFTDLQNDQRSLRTGLCSFNGIITSAYLTIRPRHELVSSEYFHYVLHFVDTLKVFYNMGGGMRQSLDWHGVSHMFLPIPPQAEQCRIVAYLDERCAAIDEDVAKRREVIEKLKEYKKSLIAHAVTKGLDPNVEMKASGVEWIGEMPKDWKMTPNYVALRLTKNNVVGDKAGDYPLLSLTKQGIIKRNVEDGGKFPASFDSYQIVQPGQMVFCLFDIDETPRTVGLSDIEGMITGAYDVFEINNNVCDPRFVLYYYTAVDDGKHLRLYYKSMRKTITPPAFAHVKMPIPSLSEQRRIVSYLDERCAAIDEAVSRQEKLIEKLGEYRKSIIHHAVTGKIDCTEA